MFIEFIGILASIIVLISAVVKSTSVKKNILMRIINSVGSAVFIIYGIYISSTSVIILNAAMVIVSVYHIIHLAANIKKETLTHNVTYADIWINKDSTEQCLKNGVIGVDWAGSQGCGRWEMILDAAGIPHIHSEHMDSQLDKSFSKEILMKILDEAVVED